MIDSKKSINCLAGVNLVYQPGLFLTTALNSKKHPGVYHIRSLIEDLIDRLRLDYMDTPHVAKDYSAATSQAAMVPVLQNSDEKPLGDIEAYWSAAECQEMDNASFP
eukprot:2919531-Ditylum_brightwellii.AAC.1